MSSCREVPGTEVLIYGDGPARAAVEQILREEGNGLPVQLLGFVENDQIMKHLLECHAVVLLSDHEGLGLSLLEGMASGVVPIGLRGAPGVTEFVVDGLILTCGDIDSCAHAPCQSKTLISHWTGTFLRWLSQWWRGQA